MKTLDEVIRALRCTNPATDQTTKCDDCPYKELHIDELWYVGPSCLDEMFADALQYLKWYKELADDSEAYVKWKENPPLTWDELQQMEGKPVWIEGPFITEGPHWIIVGPSHLYNGKIVGYGKTWQAYRKEKE